MKNPALPARYTAHLVSLFSMSLRISLILRLFISILLVAAYPMPVKAGHNPRQIPDPHTLFVPILVKEPIQESSPREFFNYGVALKSISSVAGFFTNSLNGDRVFYGTTRSGDYCRLFRFNITTGRVDLVVPIYDAKGAWTIVRDGDSVYIGTYLPAALFRYDILSDSLTKVAALDPETYVWDMKQLNRSLLLGTYPSAKLFQFDIATGETSDFSSLSQEKYLRSLETHGNKIYAGIGAQKELIEFDLLTGATKNILPAAYAGSGFVYSLHRISNILIIGLSPSNEILLYDLDSGEFVSLIKNALSDPGKTTPSFGPDIYHFRGYGGYVYEYNANFQSLNRLLPSKGLIPLVGAEIVDKQYLAGLTSDAIYLELHFDGSVRNSIYLSEVGLEPVEMHPASFTAYDGTVFLSERQLRIFNTENGLDTYRLVRGEPKVLCVSNGRLYTANYTGATLWEFTQEIWKNPFEYDFSDPIFQVLDIPLSQDRPVVARCRDDYVLIGTAPNYGTYGGALTYYENKTEWFTWRNIVPNHTIRSIAIEDQLGARFAFLGTSATGGTGTKPLQENAHLVKFDLENRTVLFDVIPKDSNLNILSIEFVDGILFLLMNNGSLSAVDAYSGQTIQSNEMAGLRKIILSTDGNLYGITGDSFVLINQETLEIEVLQPLPNLLDITEDPITGEIFLISGFKLVGYR